MARRVPMKPALRRCHIGSSINPDEDAPPAPSGASPLPRRRRARRFPAPASALRRVRRLGASAFMLTNTALHVS